MRTICVVTVEINMANMVTIATLNDICEKNELPKGYLTEKQALYLRKEDFLFICSRLYSDICSV